MIAEGNSKLSSVSVQIEFVYLGELFFEWTQVPSGGAVASGGGAPAAGGGGGAAPAAEEKKEEKAEEKVRFAS